MLTLSIGRTGAAAGRLLIALLLVALAGPAGAAEPQPLRGTVKDALGRGVTGAEILLVAVGAGAPRPAAEFSDAAGRFRFADLAPGAYRLAAIKTGYLTFVASVNTLVQDSIEVVLKPAGTLEPGRLEQLPQDPSWALRLPRRGLLRELDPPVSGELPATAPAATVESRVRLDQLLSVPAGSQDRDVEPRELEASQTHVSMDSILGDRGTLRVGALREVARAGSGNGASTARAKQHGESMHLDLAYATGSDARLDVRAFYDAKDYRLVAASPDRAPPMGQEQRTWGYGASWSKQLDPASRVAVAVDYRDVSMQPAHEPSATLFDRAVGAEGSFDRAASARHAVRLALRTQLRDWLGAPGPEAAPTWSVNLQAEDTWSIRAPFSMVYGLEYDQGLDVDRTRVLAPRLGAEWSNAGWTVNARLAYHAVDDAAGYDGERPLGYAASLELPVAQGLKLLGGTSYRPVLFGTAAVDGPVAADGHPLYLTGGNASVHENRLALREDRGGSSTHLELVFGRATGDLTALLPFEPFGPVLDERQLRYGNARFGVLLPTLGTDLQLGYQRIVSRDPAVASGESIHQSIDLRLSQDLALLEAAGDWRLLLAVRLGTVEADALDDWEQKAGDTETLQSLNRRVSAGVSVAF